MFDHVFACPVNNRNDREDRPGAAADPPIALLPGRGRGSRSVPPSLPGRRHHAGAELSRLSGLPWPQSSVDGQRSTRGSRASPRREPLPGRSALRYTEATWAEDRATRGRDPSADPGAKTGVGGWMPPLRISGIGPKAINPLRLFLILDGPGKEGYFLDPTRAAKAGGPNNASTDACYLID